MSSRNAPAPSHGSMPLLAFALFLMLNSITSSSSLSIAAGPDKIDVSVPVRNEDKTLTEEDLEHLSELSPMVKRASSRTYNFGLGKRDWNGRPSELLFNKDKLIEFLRQNNLASPRVDFAEGPSSLFSAEPFGIKRSKPQRFSFGLGKRMEEVPVQEDSIVEDSSADDSNGSRNKRKVERYQFGLGKRAPFYWFGMGSKSARGIDEFKRRYNFGLGK